MENSDLENSDNLVREVRDVRDVPVFDLATVVLDAGLHGPPTNLMDMLELLSKQLVCYVWSQ